MAAHFAEGGRAVNLVDTILGRANAFTRQFVRENRSLFRWATVVSVSPLRIRYDGSPSPSPIAPALLAHVQPQVGDRVRVETTRGSSTVIGKLS